MRVQRFLITAAIGALLAAPVGAQSVKKVGDETHHELKKAGNEIKQGAKDVGSATHHTLKTAGNDTKTALGNATGVHKVGGDVGKAAQSFSRHGKKVARSAKHSLKKNKAEAHGELTRTGKDTKAAIKSEKP
jgi:gas vesicle protein